MVSVNLRCRDSRPLLTTYRAGSVALAGTMVEVSVDSANLTDTPPSGGSFENQPAGFTHQNDQNCSSLPPGNGWFTNAVGGCTVISDSGAPVSPNGVWQFKYPAGFAEGSAPDNLQYYLPSSQTEIYFGFIWKCNSTWEGDVSNINKLGFFYTENGGPRYSIVPEMYGSGSGPFQLTSALTETGAGENRNFADANVGDGTLVGGQWYQLEWYMKCGTTISSFNGIYKSWIKTIGTDTTPRLVTNYTDINYNNPAGFTSYECNPTWGGFGAGTTKAHDDFFYWDHIRIAWP